MTIAPGTRFGRYEVMTLLGAGGMGEVYRARDSRLGREVAIKVLSSRVSTDEEQLQRFEQEARSAGSLNHPNILVVHDIGTHEGSPYVVSELLEGETLRERLGAGRLPTSKALDYGIQVARGLAAAHGKGIVHRDLKPENLFITKDGRVKILDFGLAKLLPPTVGSPAHSQATTFIPELETQPGVIMGTAGYMSPEQVRGQPVDSRSDIFSFGAVLYEMLAGERAFKGTSLVETMNAILKDDPPEIAQPDSGLNRAIEQAVRHCIEKNPQERFQSAQDLAFNLEAHSATSGGSLNFQKGSLPSTRLNRRSMLVAIGVALVIAALGIWWVLSKQSRAAPGKTISVNRLTDFTGLEEFPAVSPDRKSVAFTAEADGKRQIWMRMLAGGPPLQVTRDAADHLYPRWSPDASSILYYSPAAEGESKGAIWEIPVFGGSAHRVANSIGGVDLSHDGDRIAYFRLNDGQIELTVAARDGSAPRTAARLAANFKYFYPRWSPDDEWIGYERMAYFEAQVFVVRAKGGEPRAVIHDRSILNGFSWTSDGRRLVYSSSRGSTILYLPPFNLWVAPLAGGEPRQLTFGETSYIQPDLDRAGSIVASRMRMQFNIWKYPGDGTPPENVRRAVQITRQTGQVQTPSVGPGDREMVYLSDSGGHGNLWVMKLESGETRQITFERDPGRPVGVPVWSPDGKHISFVIRSPTAFDVDLWLINPDGSNLRKIKDLAAEAAWSGDGNWLYHASTNEGESDQIMKVQPEGGQPVPVRPQKDSYPAPAPDGTALYFIRYSAEANESPDLEIFVARPESGPGQLLTRIPGSRVPIWQILQPVISPDGKWLALPLTDGGVTNLWALSTSSGELRQITDFGSRSTFIARRVSWSSDGKYIFAALGEGDADVVLLDGLEP